MRRPFSVLAGAAIALSIAAASFVPAEAVPLAAPATVTGANSFAGIETVHYRKKYRHRYGYYGHRRHYPSYGYYGHRRHYGYYPYRYRPYAHYPYRRHYYGYPYYRRSGVTFSFSF